MTAQLVAHNLRFAHGPAVILDGVSLTVAPGHRVGIVGPNGIGKSTLLGLLAGTLAPESGSVDRVPADGVVALLGQELDIADDAETVAELIARRTGIADITARFEAASAGLARGDDGAADAYDRALTQYLRLRAAEHESDRDQVLGELGLDLRHLGQPAATLSGGQRARTGLACVLLATADVLLLDEPTNDLDLPGLGVLEDHLVGRNGGLVVVSHDRAFLERVTTSILEIDEHSRTARRFEGGYGAYLEERARARQHDEEAYATYQAKRQHLVSQAQQKREWADQGRKAAVKRPRDGDKFVRAHNIAQTERLAGKAKQAERALNRLDVNEKVDKPWEGWELRLSFAETSRPGARVAACRGLVVERGSFQLGPLDLDIGHGERVALIGANGSGKTTLLDALLGRVELTAGEAHLGPSVVVGHLDQGRARFATGRALLDTYVADTGVAATDARSQLAKLGLGADHLTRPAHALSPGERTRAVLAAFAQVGVNLLVLDEPTNHLDLPAIEQLEVALEQFTGTVILVTHDRRMLDTVRLSRRIELAGGGIVADVDLT